MKRNPFILYSCMWLAWAVWSMLLAPNLALAPVPAVLRGILIKAIVWVLPFVLLKKLRWADLFQGSFPWFACVVMLCASAAFLHTVRLLNGLQNTYVIFDPMMIVLSLSAGVLEELAFRGGFFQWQSEKSSFLLAAVVNGGCFALYHFPELLVGQWQGLISLRAILIFVMGILFCWMFKRWRNLSLNMTVHTIWNILSYLFCLAG